MLRGNLSTRPFYNERLVAAALLLGALVAIGLGVFNAREILALTRARTEHKAKAARDEAEAARIRGDAAALARSVEGGRLSALAAATREANALIDQRTFSWTVFFDQVEKTLPIDARLMAVSPRVEKGVLRITMIVNARHADDLAAFVDALLGTGTFYDLGPSEQHRNDDGTTTATIVGTYLPPAGPEVAPARTPDAAGTKGKGRP
jgi:hypothetical protein